MVFGLACGSWASLWFLGELVVLGRACGSWASLWFLGAFHFPSPTDPYARAHLTSIDEDALEGLYFAFSLIHVLLPYFSPYRRPRGSCDLIRARYGVLVAVGLQGAGVHRRAHSDEAQQAAIAAETTAKTTKTTKTNRQAQATRKRVVS